MNNLICEKSVLVLDFSTIVCCMVLAIKISFDFCTFLVIKVSMRIEVSWIWPQYESRSKQKLCLMRGRIRMWKREANAGSGSSGRVVPYLQLVGIAPHELPVISWTGACRLLLRGLLRLLRKDSLVSVGCRAVYLNWKMLQKSTNGKLKNH